MPVGPLVGGWLLNQFRWQSIFIVNLPVVAAALIACAWLLPADGHRRASRRGSFDLAGAGLSALGIVAVVYGTIEQPTQGWGSAQVIVSLAVGVAALSAFLAWERKAPHPLVDLGMLRDRRFAIGAMIAVLVMFAASGILFVVPQFLQGVLGYDAFGTGLRILPLIGGLMLSAAVSDSLVPRLGARVVIALGLLALVAGGLLGSRTSGETGYGFTALWLAVTGLGFGVAIVPATTLVMSSLPEERTGSGTSFLETVQQVGSVLGIAGLGSVLSARYLAHLDLTGLPAAAASAFRDSIGSADAAGAGDPDLLAQAHLAFIAGMNGVLEICAVVALVAVAVAACLIPRGAGKAQVAAVVPLEEEE
jgi:Na+/melibiose symporter-like transporter